MRTTISAVVLGTMVGSCSSPPSLLERIIAQGELRVLTQNSPTTFYYGSEELRGIEYELAQGFAERLGVLLRIESADHVWQLIPDVARGKAHVGAAGLSVTAPRQTLVAFGPTYQSVEPQLIYRMGSPRPRSIEDLVGAPLEIESGASHAALLHAERQAVPELVWTAREDLSAEALVRRVARGEIEYAVVDSNEFALLRHYYPEARAAFGLGKHSNLAWALPREATKLREEVAAYFAEIEATGKLAAILDRYYFATRDFDFVGSRAFVRHLNSRFPEFHGLFVEAALETGIDWRLLAAVAYQESHWDPNAVSPTGVRGLMMLTEHSASIVKVRDRNDPRDSIIGGARYLRRMLDKFPERIPEEDRIWLAVAAYNIGFGHVEDARIITEMQGGNPDRWQDVRKRLPLLSDEAWFKRVRRGYAPGSVPVLYVENIRRYYALLDWMPGIEIVSFAPAPPAAAPTTG